MADNIASNPGAGPEIATDDAGAAGHVQVIKQAISADGSATPIPADATAGLRTYVRPDDVTSGTFTDNGQSVTSTVQNGMGTVVFAFFGTYSTGSVVQFEGSFDGGTTYWPLLLANGAVAAAPGSARWLPVNGVEWFEGALPAGATHVRARVSSWAAPTGTINVRVAQAVAGYETAVSVASGSISTTSVASNVRLGHIATAGIWQDDTSIALTASATYTGTLRDLTATATGTAFASASMYAAEFRALAISDVTGSLYLEVSRDSTTWRRFKRVDTTQVEAGGLFAAEINYRPATRYARVVYINGADAQTHFLLQSLYLA